MSYATVFFGLAVAAVFGWAFIRGATQKKAPPMPPASPSSFADEGTPSTRTSSAAACRAEEARQRPHRDVVMTTLQKISAALVTVCRVQGDEDGWVATLRTFPCRFCHHSIFEHAGMKCLFLDISFTMNHRAMSLLVTVPVTEDEARYLIEDYMPPAGRGSL